MSGSRSDLPEKYEVLYETFLNLECVVLLMRMKRIAPVFSSVCSPVEEQTDRRFTHEQLAQVKFILPEAMVLKKVSVLDEATGGMKYDIHIRFEYDAIKTDGKAKSGGPRAQLRKVFRSRLLNFLNSHPEDTEIPEGPLPEPFGRPSEKPSQATFYTPSNSLASASSSNLPEKYEMLCETFHSLECVVGLMRMRGISPAFSNVCSKVQQLTDRRFTHEKLAQIKFILPEAMVLKKVSVLDEATGGMKYDIHIRFELDAIKTDGKAKGGCGMTQLRRVFRSRLLDFFNSHPEETEIPEGPLPEPFGRPSEKSSQDGFSLFD